MLCSEILCNPLQLAYTLCFKVTEIIVKCDISVSVARINIIEFASVIRIKRQAKKFRAVSINIQHTNIIVFRKISDSSFTRLTFSTFFVTIGNSYKFLYYEISVIYIRLKNGLKLFQFVFFLFFVYILFDSFGNFFDILPIKFAVAVLIGKLDKGVLRFIHNICSFLFSFACFLRNINIKLLHKSPQ